VQKRCGDQSNKCELKNEADNTLYDFAHRKENKPRQQQGDEKAHRSLRPRGALTILHKTSEKANWFLQNLPPVLGAARCPPSSRSYPASISEKSTAALIAT